MEPGAGELSVPEVGGERVVGQVEVEEAAEAGDRSQSVVVHQTVGSQIEMNLTRSLYNLTLLTQTSYQVVEVSEGPELFNVVVAEQEDAESGVRVESGDLAQPVVAQVEVCEVTEELQPRTVGYLVVRAVQCSQSWGPGEGVPQPPEVTVGHVEDGEAGPGGGGGGRAQAGGELRRERGVKGSLSVETYQTLQSEAASLK